MLVRIGQNATRSRMPMTRLSIFAAGKDASAAAPKDAGELARSSSARVPIVVVILPSAIGAQIVVRQHRSEQGNTVGLDALIGLHRALPVGDAAAQHQNRRIRQSGRAARSPT